MATPAEPSTGAPDAPPPGQEPGTGGAGAPDPHGSPGQGTPPDDAQRSGWGSGQQDAPEPPADDPTESPAAETDPAAEPDPDKPKSDRPEISELPQWAQDLIRETRGEVARSRVEAKKQAAEEAAAAATKKVTEDIGRALGLITDDAPEEESLTPEQLQSLLEGERTSTKMARTELAVFKAAVHPDNDLPFNAAALLDSRAFMEAARDIDPSDPEAVMGVIRTTVENNPWLKLELEPAPEPEVDPRASVPAAPQPPAPPSGGSFAGGPGGQSQDPTSMSIDDFRSLRRNTPRS